MESAEGELYEGRPHLIRSLMGTNDYKSLIDFRHAEFDAVAQILGLPSDFYDRDSVDFRQCFIECTFPNEAQAERFGQHCFTAKGVYEVIAKGATADQLVASARKAIESKADSVWRRSDQTRSLSVSATGFNYTVAEQGELAKRFDFLGPFRSQSKSHPPDHLLTVLVSGDKLNNNPDKASGRVEELFYLARLINDCGKGRSKLVKYALPKRKFLGPTSLPVDLSFLMANMGLVKPGSLVLDPFVGTGSILISAADRGAVTVGSDLDFRVIHGLKKGIRGPTLFDSFKQYDLGRPELLCLDSGGKLVWPARTRFDAILTDPPYGVRAGAKKVGKRRTRGEEELGAGAGEGGGGAGGGEGGDVSSFSSSSSSCTTATPMTSEAITTTAGAAAATTAAISANTTMTATTITTTAAATTTTTTTSSSTTTTTATTTTTPTITTTTTSTTTATTINQE
eukprot:gb/GEZN01006190.1/.p1 GENE.gb/GEZN01006190.1/~~gb/GEZN01006190.1/.p1  ORF type:complete len:454 (-),score=82.10 gb/GEZN01006190.1/:298-1659(-)